MLEPLSKLKIRQIERSPCEEKKMQFWLFEEVVSPSISHFLLCADSSYTKSKILQAERYVLKTLDWNLSYPNPVHYLRRISKADDYNVKVRTLAKYSLEIGVLEWRLIAAPPSPPSLMAAAAIWLARMALCMEQWVRLFLSCILRFWTNVFPTDGELGSLLVIQRKCLGSESRQLI